MKYFIWSNYHGEWLTSKGSGYTRVLSLAGTFPEDEVLTILNGDAVGDDVFREGVYAAPLVAIRAVTL